MSRIRMLAGLALPLALGLAACSSSDDRPRAETPHTPPQIAASDGLGVRLPAQPRALLVSVDSLIVGTRAVEVDPGYLGGKPIPPADPGAEERTPTTEMVGGLLVQDRRTGATRVYTAADGFPTMPYASSAGSWGEQTATVFDLAWVEPDRSFVGAAWTRLVRGDLDESGTYRFRSAALRRDGAGADAVITQVELAGGLLFVAGDQGIAVVSPDDLTVQRWIDFGRPVAVFGISAGTFAGETAVAAFFGEGDAAMPTGAALVHADGTVQPFEMPEGAMPTAVLVVDEAVFVGLQTRDGEGAIYAWADAGDGTFAFAKKAGKNDLSTPARVHSVVPNVLALDYQDAALLVGGRMVRADGGGPGGGLVSLRRIGAQLERAKDVVPKQSPLYDALPWTVDALAADHQGSIYFAGRQLCDERKTRQMPVFELEGTGEQARLAQAWISGVRSISFDPVAHDTWLGLRDEDPYGTCLGAVVQESLCRLRADGSCEITVPVVNADVNGFAALPSVSAIAFGPVEDQRVAVATVGNGVFVESGDVTRFLDVAAHGVSLRTTAAAWSDDGALWVASAGAWERQASQAVNRRNPHGLGYFALDETGAPTLALRYVRERSDQRPETDVPGLPSDTVYDVLALPGHRRALVALGVDRERADADHLQGMPAERAGHGGLALIDGTTVEILAAPAGTTMGEVVALARSGSGAIYALDERDGLFAVDVQAKKATRIAAAPWAGNGADPAERGLSLAVDGAGHLAVGSTRGLYLFDAHGASSVAFRQEDGPNYVWDVAFAADGVVYAGTDRGLRRVAVAGASLPAWGPEEYEGRWLYVVDPPGISVGRPCSYDGQCPEGSSCVGQPVNGALEWTCSAADACAAQPGGPDCPCAPSDDDACSIGFACNEDGRCAIPRESDCGGVAGCACDEAAPCAEGFYCGDFRLCLPAPADFCLLDCSCAGEGAADDGCLDGYACRSVMGGGQQCLEVSCVDTCSCTGEGIGDDGCPDGMACVTDAAGQPTCGGGVGPGPGRPPPGERP